MYILSAAVLALHLLPLLASAECDPTQQPGAEIRSGSSSNRVAYLAIPVTHIGDNKLHTVDFGFLNPIDGTTCYMTLPNGTTTTDVKTYAGGVVSWTCTWPYNATLNAGLPGGKYELAEFYDTPCGVRNKVGKGTDIYFGRADIVYQHGEDDSVSVTCTGLPLECPKNSNTTRCAQADVNWYSAYRTNPAHVDLSSSTGRLVKGGCGARGPYDLLVDPKCASLPGVNPDARSYQCRFAPVKAPRVMRECEAEFTGRYQACATQLAYYGSKTVVRSVKRPNWVTVDGGKGITVDCSFDACEV